ncbi:tail fiber domain-containing protein [Chryseobacterium sp. WG14]|uniref:tail fiber domain-containing protein n=1 Tax=unclassified Chryseobacterium TaxID=2593645 RepID=UPI00211EBCB2|nr:MULTISPECIES: tail fiber domain-containing protein [unclassified Chryseobacterium]MCQ9634208.1 tail fiber domain-containing protein [Chryseobacterium sp. WG23]MCQ9638128.1 tail fiber domain-containing protein [Chryseobacterium sp. WG14]
MRKKLLSVIAVFSGCYLIIAQSGNVGINTSAPASKLAVNGNLSIGNAYVNTAAPADGSIIAGSTKIGAGTPYNMLTVQANEDISQTLAPNIIARFDPLGGSDFNKDASIIINGGRSILGYSNNGKPYSFLRGNQSTDLRLQVVDAGGVLFNDSFVISGANNNTGFVGINTPLPQASLDVRLNNIKALANNGVQTGLVWSGTSNYSGFEAYTAVSGDAWVGIQRSGPGAPLHLTKSAGTTDGEFINFSINGVGIGSIRHDNTSVFYNTISDMRLKENIRSSKSGLAALKNIGIYDYNYKADKKKELSTGVLAQELYKVYPMAVTPGGENEKSQPWQVDYSKLVPILIKSIQDLEIRNKLLKTRIAELRNKTK